MDLFYGRLARWHTCRVDPPADTVRPNLSLQSFERYWTFVLIAVIRTKRHGALPRLHFRSCEYGQWNQVVAPDAVVCQRNPIVTDGPGEVKSRAWACVICRWIGVSLLMRAVDPEVVEESWAGALTFLCKIQDKRRCGPVVFSQGCEMPVVVGFSILTNREALN